MDRWMYTCQAHPYAYELLHLGHAFPNVIHAKDRLGHQIFVLDSAVPLCLQVWVGVGVGVSYTSKNTRARVSYVQTCMRLVCENIHRYACMPTWVKKQVARLEMCVFIRNVFANRHVGSTVDLSVPKGPVASRHFHILLPRETALLVMHHIVSQLELVPVRLVAFCPKLFWHFGGLRSSACLATSEPQKRVSARCALVAAPCTTVTVCTRYQYRHK
jgi:hypothetical protein